MYTSNLGTFDITSRQMVLLIAIGQNPGASQKAVGEMVALDVNTVSDTLRRMERKGLILRETSKLDARTICLRVTEKGFRQMQAMQPALQSYNEALQDRLTEEEAVQLKRLIRKMLQLEVTAPAA
ncbi:MarR family winged helix-turn-helix transcriptional regulator [Pseudooceanicola albus]|nr:MarR family transcriptional regulator [Pseudooceanicola albus]